MCETRLPSAPVEIRSGCTQTNYQSGSPSLRSRPAPLPAPSSGRRAPPDPPPGGPPARCRATATSRRPCACTPSAPWVKNGRHLNHFLTPRIPVMHFYHHQHILHYSTTCFSILYYVLSHPNHSLVPSNITIHHFTNIKTLIAS